MEGIIIKVGNSQQPVDVVGVAAASGESAQGDAPEQAQEEIAAGKDSSGPPDAEGGDNEAPPQPNETVAPVVLSSGAVTHGKTLTINCIDCGAERRIKPQDAFQVKRCINCQKKARNAQRSELRKVQRKKAKEQNPPT